MLLYTGLTGHTCHVYLGVGMPKSMPKAAAAAAVASRSNGIISGICKRRERPVVLFMPFMLTCRARAFGV